MNDTADTRTAQTSIGTVIAVGTRKGLWLGRSDAERRAWEWTGPHHPMEEVYSVLLHDGTLTAGCSSSWFGPQLRRSSDLGETWSETPGGPIRFPEDTDAALERVWQLQPGPASTGEGDVLWAGVEPGAVFRSSDGGKSFELVRSLWDHPHRPEWNAGFGGQAFHTILPHPTDPQVVLAALSTGGCYRTEDAGATWEPSNTGIKCDFMPGVEPVTYPEFGQCVHKVARDAEDPERLYLQNHGGVFRSDDGGRSWSDIAPGLPAEFGFAVVAHPHRGDTAYVFPIADAGARWPVDGHARVWRTTDAGATWEALGEGQLPDDYYSAVMRDAMCADGHNVPGLYVGGRNGAVFASPDEGTTWTEIVNGLPDVMCVRAYAV